MAKGENIFKRKDGRWEARYIRGHEETGKIRYGFCYGRTYREAKEKVTVCKAAVAAGEPPPQIKTAQHFSFFCDAWLAVRKTQVRVSTYSKYAAVLEKHIKPHLGRYLPQDITTAAVDAFSQELLASLSPKTVHDILVTLHGILKYTAGCVAQALPHVEIHYPKEEKREMRVLTREEQARFVAYLSADITPCKFGLLLALFTGMRIGELCALKWENICVAERTVRVTATLQRLQENGAAEKGHTHIVIGAPKSGASARIIPLTAQTAALFCRCRQRRRHMSSRAALPIWSRVRCNIASKNMSAPAGCRASTATRCGTRLPPARWRWGLKSNRCPKFWGMRPPRSRWSAMFTPRWS